MYLQTHVPYRTSLAVGTDTAPHSAASLLEREDPADGQSHHHHSDALSPTVQVEIIREQLQAGSPARDPRMQQIHYVLK